MERVSDSRPPLTTTTSIVPAMIVVGIAVATLAIFMVINIVANPRVTTTTQPIAIVGGLALDPANAALGACAQAGTPPTNIVGSLLLPVATTSTSSAIHANGGAGDYDCLRHFSTHANAGAILGFYRTRLEAQGWSLFSSGSSHALAQLLFQKAGSDTFYWVVGVTINQRANADTLWTYRIYQNSSMI
jgi:hypothetical protein